MIDIVIPNNDEPEFIKMAERLGLEGVCFLYEKAKDISQLQKTTKLPLYAATAQLSKQADLRLARGKEQLRDVLEKTNVDIVFELEEHKEHDHMDQRNSGMNHVLCAIAHEKTKIVAFSAASLLSTGGKSRAQILGRMMQNIRLCRKGKVEMTLASFARSPWQMRAEGEMRAIGLVLGMRPDEAKAAIGAVKARIARNRKRRSPDYLGEGIERF